VCNIVQSLVNKSGKVHISCRSRWMSHTAQLMGRESLVPLDKYPAAPRMAVCIRYRMAPRARQTRGTPVQGTASGNADRFACSGHLPCNLHDTHNGVYLDLHVDEQVSPSRRLKSSHSSPGSRMPFPHSLTFFTHSFVQVSVLVRPSSHSSPLSGSKMPFPHTPLHCSW